MKRVSRDALSTFCSIPTSTGYLGDCCWTTECLLMNCRVTHGRVLKKPPLMAVTTTCDTERSPYISYVLNAKRVGEGDVLALRLFVGVFLSFKEAFNNLFQNTKTLFKTLNLFQNSKTLFRNAAPASKTLWQFQNPRTLFITMDAFS